MRWEYLKLRSNTLHAKFVAQSRTEELQILRFNSCEDIEKDEIVPERVDTVSEMSYEGLSGTENVTKGAST